MNSGQIMIVEDERIVAADLQQTLEEFGYSVIGIEKSGRGAVSKADHLKPDLILMDIMLKGDMNGIQAAGQIGSSQDIPVVYITAYADNTTIREALETNPFGYIKKPFSRDDLKASVEIALTRHEREINEKRDSLAGKENLHGQDEIFSLSGSSAGLDFFESSISYDPSIGKPKFKLVNPPRTYNEEVCPFNNILGKYNTDLYNLLCDLKYDRISQQGINLLIKVSFKLAHAKVKKNINRIFNINKRWELSAEDIAIEGISNLFILNSKRNMLNLRYNLLNWNEPVTDNLEALFFLNKTINICVEQYINRMLRDSDPAFAKVLDTINFAIRKFDYRKADYFGTVYIVKRRTLKISGNVISQEELPNLPVDFRQSKKDILSRIMDHLEKETEYFPAIPLNSLIETLLGNCRSVFAEIHNEVPSDFDRICIDGIIYNALEKTILKLKVTYLNTNKLNEQEVENLICALTDIASDLREGNTIWQLSDYLKVYFKEMTRAEYKAKYQYILEYIVKIFKQNIANDLQRNWD